MRALTTDKLWHVDGPFRDEAGLYWRAGRVKSRRFEAAQSIVARFNRRVISIAERRVAMSLHIGNAGL